ncbi:MAG: CBS domain-containing protein [Patescibacteria group bacterium]
MTKKVISASPEAGIKEVSCLLMKYKIHGIPVVDEKGRILGIITETDFFTKDEVDIYLPSYIDILRKTKILNAATKDKDKKIHQALLGMTAGDIMTKKVITIEENRPIKDLYKLFRRKKLFTVPVVNEESLLVGIVTLADIIKLIK